MRDGIPNNCSWEQPDTKVCTTAWSTGTRESLLRQLRWESIVPYPDGFADPHHPEVPGGQVFLTAASSPTSPARHWTALRPNTSLDVLDAPDGACLWTATAVGVQFRELLPYEPPDLAKLRSPGNVAAAAEARDAAALWDRLSPERQSQFQKAFPPDNPSPIWCAPDDLPPWTLPAAGVLSLSADWDTRFDKCRWTIPRPGFWEWALVVKYTSEQGDRHTETLASDMSWFREPGGYAGQQVTWW